MSPHDKIFEPSFWKERIETAQWEHSAVYICSPGRWADIGKKHTEILTRVLSPLPSYKSVLDVGCGWGRLLEIMPEQWYGPYMGIDLSPEFIDKARKRHLHRAFLVRDVREGIPNLLGDKKFDIAVLISIRQMVIGNCGHEEWEKMESEIRKVASKILYLEYDPEDEGVLE